MPCSPATTSTPTTTWWHGGLRPPGFVRILVAATFQVGADPGSAKEDLGISYVGYQIALELSMLAHQ